MGVAGSGFSSFEATLVLERQAQERVQALKAILRENEKSMTTYYAPNAS